MRAQRQQSPDELLDAARRMHRRLGKVLDALDAGDDDAIYELASALRTTLCFGKGDRLLLRLCNTFHVEPPTVLVPPARRIRSEQLVARIGPIPSDEYVLDTEKHDRVSVFQWVQQPAVVLPEVGSNSWEKVIAAYANTHGAHVSPTVPQLLDDIQVFQGPHGHMGGYLLRVAAAIAENSMGYTLAQIDDGPRLHPRKLHPRDVSIVTMIITDEWPVEFGFSCTAETSVELLSMPFGNGKRFRAVWDWDSRNQTGSLRTSVE